jgi:hypothetical protein
MKTKRFEKKLSLNKVTLVNLVNHEMNSVRGQGTYGTCAQTCGFCDTKMQTCRRCPAIQTEYPTCQPGPCGGGD